MELPQSYRAQVVTETKSGFIREIKTLPLADLKKNEVLIRVEYSSLNYKDALSAHGNKGITRNFPHTTGIDAAGQVVASDSVDWHPGDEVIVTGYDLGMNTAGGHANYISVPANWIVKRPENLSAKHCMTLGTAGFTAAQCLFRTQQLGLSPDKGPIVITGATGGVGSVAVALYANAGYEVVAASRNPESAKWLLDLGASQLISSADLITDSPKPLAKGQWAGAVDTVGGKILESILKTTQQRAVVTICGMITGHELSTTVFPFILRGLSLIGIDSAECPLEMKKEIWSKLAGEWNASQWLDTLENEITLDQVPSTLEAMMQGNTTGRVVVKIK